MIDRLNLAGKISNTTLSENKPLMPLFEAVVNSFQAIEDLGESHPTPRIEIIVDRDPVLSDGVGDLKEGEVDGFTIIDTGIGFTETNYIAFITSDTQNKASRGGKGLGRFVWLKAFEYVVIESHFYRNGGLAARSFRLSINGSGHESANIQPSNERSPKTIIKLVGFKNPYKKKCPKNLRTIAHRIVEHCLPFFLDPKVPSVIIKDDSSSVILNEHFRESFASKATQHQLKACGKDFTMKGLRMRSPNETHHRLIYAANSREVKEERLDKFIPNLQKRLNDEEGKFSYLGFVEGEYLNRSDSVNNERTDFTFPMERSEDGLLDDEITLEDIRAGAIETITAELKPFLDELNEAKKATVVTFIRETPQYRPLGRYLHEFIDKLPPGTSGKKLDAFLHEQKYEKQRQLTEETQEIFDAATKESLKPEDYEARVNSYIERANELGKSSLAEYVVHRKVMLEFLEKSLQYDQAAGKYPDEDIIHRIVFPKNATTDDVSYEQQNLWIIDEKLAFHYYLASDKLFSSMEPLDNESDSRPDLLAFDRALSYREGEGPLSSVVIVEFKKPMRKNFGPEDPVEQAYRMLRRLRSGQFLDENQRPIPVRSKDIPAFIYVICDKVGEVETMAENKGMKPTPDGEGYYAYNDPMGAYVEIIPYSKLLNDAKKRNQILFNQLRLPLHFSVAKAQ
jgi:hypothetical protein